MKSHHHTQHKGTKITLMLKYIGLTPPTIIININVDARYFYMSESFQNCAALMYKFV